MPPKRKGSGKQAAKGKAKQPKQDGQKAVSHDINVPIDEGFSEWSSGGRSFAKKEDCITNFHASGSQGLCGRQRYHL